MVEDHFLGVAFLEFFEPVEVKLADEGVEGFLLEYGGEDLGLKDGGLVDF